MKKLLRKILLCSLFLMGFGGGGGGSSSADIKSSAPGSTAAATIDSATEGDREKVRQKLAKARGRNYTDKTSGTINEAVQNAKKLLLGE